ncbi:chlorophyll synthesis pathway protein BchC [Thiorhodovibrio frisius]|uniref:2-desacetyl-2-hydroxyethyl bacteriochlorophyllide A dehydrogenase n=1 Tax=Thiorhodovibrio frisius TaxID=631362 RepID=H8Z3Q1_9GAMM|nr:chlorophyll synthesis pathway protein BchC [Thiorhodovibrio frisius]EIC20040.1 2-desacetyl-2-hydroxyethyl bacteriochlorophyllide A dehydrogenase [Thiorhodovibrio frisius]WPL20768.1 2-desacetyl-2-hydroxyethyl bacteriochlorophyllide A dehydrogenase [Thiorhodovibrio frisius]
MPIDMNTLAVVLEQPEQLAVRRLDLTPPSPADCVVGIHWSGISTGTERLLWSGRMPPFPGLAYPLVPGYESVGQILAAGEDSGRVEGEQVFVPGARCYGEVAGLFGGAASRVVAPGNRLLPLPANMGEKGVLMALAATAHHAIAPEVATGQAHSGQTPDLIIGHGVLGRLLARLAVVMGGKPVVWERNPERVAGAEGYQVIDPASDERRDYRCICDVSGDSKLLDILIARMAPGGEIVLGGFYEAPLSFDFPPAFMRELRLRVAAEFKEPDLIAVKSLIESGRLSFDGLITHRLPADQAAEAYVTAFSDPSCLKMILDWRHVDV